jgi:phage terminase large subunit-like protein
VNPDALFDALASSVEPETKENPLLKGIYFDLASVELDFAFIESLTLTKSTKSGRPEPFRLLPFQKKFIGNLLGWKRADESRLYRRGLLSMGRKNAKTQTVAAIGLDLLVMDDEAEPEIYAAAKTSEQSGKIFEAAAGMVNASEELSEFLKVTPYRREIYNTMNGGKLRALTADGRAKHGSNPSALLFDELHVWGAAEQELYDALTTGSGARRQPLEIIISTAGINEETLYGREIEYARRVLNRVVDDPEYFAMIFEVPKDADWTDESLWVLANPSLGEIVKMDYLRTKFTKAINSPSEQTAFKRLYLNMWVNSRDIWIPLQKWDACKWTPPIALAA